MSKKENDKTPPIPPVYNYTEELQSIALSQRHLVDEAKLDVKYKYEIANTLKQIALTLYKLLETEQKNSVHLREIAICVCKLVVQHPATGFKIQQQAEGESMAITGVPVGGTGTFVAVTAPPGGTLQAGNIPVWTVDDALVSITPSADGFSVNASVGAADTAASFNLTISGVSSNGSAISTVTNVPILPAAAVPATGFTVNQTA